MAATSGVRARATAEDLSTLRRVAQEFQLGDLAGAQIVTEGLMNRNWRVVTAAGSFAVKQVRDVDPDAARRQHRAVAALAASGLPVPAPIGASDGDTLAAIDGAVYSVVGWVRGAHRDGLDLTPTEAAALGGLLAELHNGLAVVMPPAPESVLVPVTDLATATAKLARYQQLIESRPAADDFDLFAAAELGHRTRLLHRVARYRPTGDALMAPADWTHGDFQHLNLLWHLREVTAVLDWDRLAVRPVATEIVRSATLLFGFGDTRGLDLDRVAAFTTGYRAVRTLTDGQLRDAVHRLWWERVSNDLWQLRLHCDNGDISCDHLFRSASALLGWWTDHRDEVESAFTNR